MNRLIYRPGRTTPIFAPSVDGLGGIMEPHNPMIPQEDKYYETAYYVNPYQEPNYLPAQAPIESPIMSSALLNPVENVRHHKGYGMAYTPAALHGGASDAANLLSFANLFLR
jgi:hypothetical protein